MRRIVLCLLLVIAAAPALGKKLAIGQPAPAIETTTLEGATFTLAQHRGQVVLVNFWATWCAPCRAEMPAIDAFYRAHKDEGLVVIAISLDEPEDLAQVRQVMAQFSFPAALISQTQAKAYGRLWRLPLSFVIDRDGVLRRDAWQAAPTLDAATLDAELLPLLQKPASP